MAKHLAKIFSQTDSLDQHVTDQESSFYQDNSSDGVDEMIDEELLDGLSEEEFDSLIDDDLDKLEEAESNYE